MRTSSRWKEHGQARAVGALRVAAAGRLGALAALVLFVQSTSGCLSNEYRIPPEELQRQAALPAPERGHRVYVVQELGDRRGAPVETQSPPQADGDDGGAYAEGEVDVQDDGSGSVHIDASGDGGGGRAHGRGWRAGRAGSGGPRVATAGHGGLHGTPPGGGGGLHGTPPGGGGGAHGGGGGGGWHSGGGNGGGGGGGGGAGAALAVVAVVLVAVAVVAVIALGSCEGTRFDGFAEIPVDQPLYVKDADGRESTVSLATVTPEEAARATEVTVKDDEWLGLLRLERGPLNRTGLAFKLDMGSSVFNVGLTQVVGVASQIQVGAFVTQQLGLMLDIGLSGGGLCCAGFYSRHSLALEVQAMPLSLWRLHLGAFAKGGVAIVGGDTPEIQSGPIAGGGALLELALTSRLALSLRAAANAANLPTGWSTSGSLTAGFAIY
jgi:hypothetical protein